MSESGASHRIAGAGIQAVIKPQGAELCSLKDADGREFLWQAQPPWQRHAPVLFPIVGRLHEDRLLYQGRAHRLTQHGFARDLDFTWLERSAQSCRLALASDQRTLEAFPFPFRLTLGYACEAATLRITLEIANPGPGPLPVSFGLHPAFAWPLPGAPDKSGHWLEFGAAEAGRAERLEAGLLAPGDAPLPLDGQRLPLADALFARDALILRGLRSRRLHYRSTAGSGLEIAWSGLPDLGLWARPDADFLCIEPWHGYNSPAGWQGEFPAKPGLLRLAPGARHQAGITLRLGAAAPG